MASGSICRSLFGWLLCLTFAVPVRGDVTHELKVTLKPQAQRLEVTDRITFDASMPRTLHFILHQGLSPEVIDGDATLDPVDGVSSGAADTGATLQAGVIAPERFILRLPAQTQALTLRYQGVIHHTIEQLGEEYARSFGISPGLIGPQGVFLAGSSYWYPQFDGGALHFSLEVSSPEGWRAVSQGRRVARTEREGRVIDTWRTDEPQEEIYLVAAPFVEYRQAAGAAEAMVFLREPDRPLAQRYLDATGQYLTLYRALIGPYPYRKFALVENFWETGYGMPSFTLLGSRVIRLPFILHSSYPHEILHNWWGNGVYVDYATGNWSEGLTSYLADHLIKEQRGQGAEYRRGTLQKYADYVREQQDFPLSAFRGRHNSVTEAVGYGKTLMLFHMLRRELGDAGFTAGLQGFYRDNLYKVASFDEVRDAFNAVATRPLDGFFEQWVRRTGAPQLRVRDARASRTSGGFELRARLEQVQDGPVYGLQVPVAVAMEDVDQAFETSVAMQTRTQEIRLHLPARPGRLDVDPQFDLFRRLDRSEIPPALSQALGAERVLLVLPAAAPRPLRAAYAELVDSWRRGRAGQFEVQLDADLQRLPDDRAVWLFGWENRFRPVFDAALAAYPYTVSGDRVAIADVELARDEHSVVAVARNPADPDRALAWVASGDPRAVAGLARKLPHYGKYSYLGFVGEAPDNMLKGQWPVPDSPMSVAVVQEDGAPIPSVEARFAPRAPLAQLPAAFSAERLRTDVAALADAALEGRGLGSDGLEQAADYIAGQFRRAGLKPGGDSPSDYFQRWPARVGAPERDLSLKNVIGILPGRNARFDGQSVVVAAHYDHLGRGWPDVHAGDAGKVHPGADDNASGVAVMLGLARLLADRGPLQRTVVFVAFTGEEAGRLGSRHYVQGTGSYPAARAIAMINLDTVGRLGDRELLALGTGSAREWVHILRGIGLVTGVTVKPVADDFGASDQKSFLDIGVPAIQLFAGVHPDYHRPGDTLDKVDSAGLVKVATVLKEAVEYLAARPESLHVTLAGKAQRPAEVPAQGRRVLLGTVPDFTFSGKGVRLSDVTSDTPAARAGLQQGDVIVGMGQREIADLRDFADALRSLQPGDAVQIRFLRGATERSVRAEVVAR
jgi:aminopeptidase N